MSHRDFWERHPALLFGLSLLIGVSGFLFWQPVFPIAWVIYLIYLRRFAPVALMVGAIFYVWAISGDLQKERRGYFSIASLQPHQSPFTKSLLYKGMFTAGHTRVPCTIHMPLSENYPKANVDYVLEGQLKQRGPYDYLFSPKKWTPVPNTWSLAELRFQMKEKIKSFLSTQLKRERVALFLSSLLTGDVEDRMLRFEFGRLGLQHILAISGFHFAILIAFCSYFLSLFLKKKGKIIALLCAINVYFLFVGALPAVQRSYLTALFFLVGKLLNRPSTPLNLLGVSLLIEVLLDPFIINGLGFQLSFLSCFGILLLRPLFLPWASLLFPIHSRLGIISAHGYMITSFLREAIAITLAVNAAILPLLLFHFHSFPLLSLLYNLFFPFAISIALFLSLLSLLSLFFFAPLGACLFSVTDWLTLQLLELVSYPPLFLDYSINCPPFPAWPIPFYLFGLFCLGLAKAKEE